VVRRLGIDVIHYPPRPGRRYAPVCRNRWMNELGVDLVLDVGANVGQYAKDIRKWGYRGRLVSFEPLSTAYKELIVAAALSPPWETHNLAVSDAPGRLTINVAGNSTSSSFLPMLDSHAEIWPASAFVSKEEVQVIALDSLVGRVVAPSDKVWLKIDVQGFELKVLQGAAKLLPQVVGLECEMSLVPLYNGEPLIEVMLDQIARLGFRLANTTEAFYDEASSRTLQLNGVFLRSSKA